MSWPPPFALGKNRSISPDSVERYLVGTFGDAPDDARAAMMEERDRLYRDSPRESRERIEILGRRIQLADELS